MERLEVDMQQFIDETEQKIEEAKTLGYSKLYIFGRVMSSYVNKSLSINTTLRERYEQLRKQTILFKYELVNILSKQGYITQIERGYSGGITVIWNDKQKWTEKLEV